MRYIPVALALTALACLAQLASAAPVGGLHRSMRMLLAQDMTPAEAEAGTINGLKKVMNGDEKQREQFVNLQYYYIGCGGKTGQRDPEELAENMIGNISKNPAYIKAGVVDTFKEIIEEALSRVQDYPLSAEDCKGSPFG